MRYLANAGDRFVADCAHRREPLGLFHGRVIELLGVLETIAAMEDQVVGNSLLALNKEEAITVLETVVNNSLYGDTAREIYEKLCEQKTRFVAVEDAPSASS